MKKLIFICVFILVAGISFAEFQLEAKVGYFFNTDTYGSEVSRSFNGLNLNITGRYFFTKNIGVFFGPNFNAWFNAENDEYVTLYESAGMQTTIDEDFGCKLDLNVGLALAFPINEKFRIQSDIGLSNTILGIESITGTVSYMGYNMSTGIFFDQIFSMGLIANLFGCYEILSDSSGKGYLTFGLMMDYKFTRTEKGEVIVSGVSSKFDDSPKFSGISITPFIGYMGRF